MKTRALSLLTVLIVLSLLLSACGAAPQSGEPIKVGGIFDLTGATADVGVPYADGLKGYVDWINAKGGIKGRKIELIGNDYAYKVPNAEQLYSQYVSQDKVVAVQGWGTGDTEALRTKIATDKLPFMSASYSANLAVMADAPYNFLIGTTYSDQMVIGLRWALQDWQAKGGSGKAKVAFFYNDSPFGKSPLPAGNEFAAANGMEVLEVAMPRGATDLTPQLSQVQAFSANYIIIQNTSGPGSLAAKNAKGLGLNAQIICLNWCADENLIKLAGAAAEGVVGTIPFAPPGTGVAGVKDIVDYTKSKNINLEEKGLHYVQGWWTMAVMAEGIKRVLDSNKPITGENLKAALETI
ncbi:MAG: ABC transporter substrate-binding protein, partial [Anaerolineae bacterium]